MKKDRIPNRQCSLFLIISSIFLALTCLGPVVGLAHNCLDLFGAPRFAAPRRSVSAAPRRIEPAPMGTIQVRRASGYFVELEPQFRPIERITLVVPVYRELKNGNLRNLLVNLRSQDVDPRRIHLILIVNNSPALARLSDHPITRENQETLERLRGIQRSLPFSVEVIDLATLGVETNMGRIRQVGVSHALRSQIEPSEHVIVNMDADTQFDRSYLSRLWTLFSHYDVDAVFPRIHFEVRDSSTLNLLRSHFLYRVGWAEYSLRRALHPERYGFGGPQITARASALRAIGGFRSLGIGEDTDLSRRLLEKNYLHTADLVVRTEDRARKDGFDAATRADGLLALSEEGLQNPAPVPSSEIVEEVLYNPRVPMLSALVERARISGFQARNVLVREFLEFMTFGPEDEHLLRGFVFSEEEQLARLRRYENYNMERESNTAPAIPLAAAALDLGSFMSGTYHNPPLVTFTPLRYQLEGEERRRFLQLWSERWNQRVDIQEARRGDIRDLLSGHELAPLKNDPSGQDVFRRFLRQQQSALRRDVDVIVHRGRTSVESFLSDQQIFSEIETRYSDWLRPFAETPHQVRFEIASFLTDWILSATQDPWQHPKTWRYIQWRQGVLVIDP